MSKKTTVLLILDGFGMGPDQPGNAALAAKMPNYWALWDRWPHVRGYASGRDVGLPAGQMGNSEVGHLNMGAGRIVYQDLTRITKAIEDGDFFQNPALCRVMDGCVKKQSALHLMGLLSDGGVHSHNTHLYALLKMAKERGVQRVYVHPFLDGRDVSPTSGAGYLRELEETCRALESGEVVSVVGRYYAMDRDNRWGRVEQAYEMLTRGVGEETGDLVAAVEAHYAAGTTDEFMPPLVKKRGEDAPAATIGPADGVVFFNFRPDRARELTRALVDPGFAGFARQKNVTGLGYVCLTQYDKTMPGVEVAFGPESLQNTLGEYLAACGKTQLRLAETEKYAHVTFFFNGGVEAPNPGEDRILVPSPKVATYDLQPQMSAPEVTEELVRAIRAGRHDVIICNYANPDMVGHTGVFEAAVAALEAVDACLGRVMEAVYETGSRVFLCADHGNCEQMLDPESGRPFTAHTANPVPFVLINDGDGIRLREGGRLADIAPTLLDMLGLPKPVEMTGESLRVGG